MEENIIEINGGIWINVNVNVKKLHVFEKDYVWNLTTCNCENGKYLASIIDDSVIPFDEIIESYDEDTKSKLYDETNFNEKKSNFKTQNVHILLVFLLITIALLIAVSCYFIKCRAKKTFIAISLYK